MKKVFWQLLSGKKATLVILVIVGVNSVILSIINHAMNYQYKVPESSISFAPAEKVAIPQKFEVLGVASPVSSQFRPRQSDARRFHFKFEGEPLDEVPYVLWIPHSGANTKVYINSAQAGSSQVSDVTLPGTGVEKHIYNIPRFQVLPGSNRVDIYVESDPFRSGLGSVYFGPKDALSQRYMWFEHISRTLPVISYLAALFAIVLNLLALLSPKGKLKFSAMSLACLSVIFLYKLNVIWPILTLALGIIIFAVVETRVHKMDFLKAIFVALGLCGPVLSVLRIAGPFSFPDPSFVFISLWVGALPILLGPPLKACLNMLSDRRSRVNELEEALDDTKGILEKEIRRRAIFEERERLTRDIHDGVGGQLLGLLLRLRTGDVERETITRDLQNGLNDLRLVVDALDHTGNDLGNALQAFRDRATNQLDAAGLSLNWTQAENLSYEPKGQDAVINLYRILQEVINNVIRHANAKSVEIDVTTNSVEQTLEIKIQDDGEGRDKNAKPGQGTLNIQRRAEILGGRVSTDKGLNNRGHSVSVILPMSKLSSEA